MKARLSMTRVAPEAYQAMQALSKYPATTGLDPKLLELVKIRASQINGCAFCLNMHINEAREKGETEERVFLLNAWREAPVYTDRERAALEWTEALTKLGPEGVSDQVYEAVHQQFTEAEIVNLSIAVVAINSWNRLMVGFRVPPAVKQSTKAA